MKGLVTCYDKDNDVLDNAFGTTCVNFFFNRSERLKINTLKQNKAASYSQDYFFSSMCESYLFKVF